jgi:hypothetical protein
MDHPAGGVAVHDVQKQDAEVVLGNASHHVGGGGPDRAAPPAASGIGIAKHLRQCAIALSDNGLHLAVGPAKGDDLVRRSDIADWTRK